MIKLPEIPLEKDTPHAKGYKHSQPFLARVLETHIINKTDGEDVAKHIVIDLKGSNLNYLCGQSFGIIAPGLREDGRPQKLRLYSIASAPYGDGVDCELAALTVKKLVMAENEEKSYGLCSSFLCDLKVGDTLPITGPTGRILLPPTNKTTDIIMVGTGTGVAPFRGFLQQFKLKGHIGKISLYLGYKNKNESLYCNHLNYDIIKLISSTNCSLYMALSREEKNKNGGKLYVTDLIAEHENELANVLMRNNFAIYICGIKGIEKSIEEIFAKIVTGFGINWDEYFAAIKHLGRWNVEVY